MLADFVTSFTLPHKNCFQVLFCKIIINFSFCVSKLVIRGGVEDTRLEAKDTKKNEAKAKDSLSEDRHSRGQGQECSRPRPRTKDTSASALQNHKNFSGDLQKKKKGLHKNSLGDLQKKILHKNFLGDFQKKRVFTKESSRPRTSSRTPPLLVIPE